MHQITKKLPDKPGVYFFKKGRKILYIGKATSLRNRVRSYFTDDLILKRSAHIKKMVSEATRVDFEITNSALEALLLESRLIKKYQPYFNTREKDDKSFNHVVITKEDYPRIFTVRGKEIENWQTKAKYVFGSFPHGTELKEALRIIRKIFPYRDFKSKIKTTSAFNKQIGLEPSGLSQKEYQSNIKNIKLLFEGKHSQILKELKQRMKKASERRDYEEAKRFRDQIFALEHINDIAMLKREVGSKYDGYGFRIEAYDIAHLAGKNTVGVMTVVLDGLSENGEYKRFEIKGPSKDKSDDVNNLKELLERRFRHEEWPKPDLIVIDGGVAQKNIAEKVLSSFKVKAPIVSVVKNEKHKPKNILGEQKIIRDYKHEILLANSEAHRFAIKYHRLKQRRVLK